MSLLRPMALVTGCVAASILNACGKEDQWSSPPVSTSADSSSRLEAALLPLDDINTTVTGIDPRANTFHGLEPIEHQPRKPVGMTAPCANVLTLYFGAGEPAYVGYAMDDAAGAEHIYILQLVA